MIKNDFLRFFDIATLVREDLLKNKSRTKLIVMSIDDFLNMANPIEFEDYDKKSRMEALALRLTTSKDKIDSIPLLFAKVDTGPNAKKAQVIGHEGRHRAMLLRQLGCKYMPVMFTTNTMRFSEQNTPGCFDFIKSWPEVLVSENQKKSIGFPIKREQSEEMLFAAFVKEQQKEIEAEHCL
ncbi:hypothetical protein [Aeromonas media]|uniref:hypothetical protein n=1 Tax=Aeromonas media TaxID=651 RepID=UPI003D1FEF4B